MPICLDLHKVVADDCHAVRHSKFISVFERNKSRLNMVKKAVLPPECGRLLPPECEQLSCKENPSGPCSMVLHVLFNAFQKLGTALQTTADRLYNDLLNIA
jgi:hypothetical protein